MDTASAKNFWQHSADLLLQYGYAIFLLLVLGIWWHWLALVTIVLILLSLFYASYKKSLIAAQQKTSYSVTPKKANDYYYAFAGGFLAMSFVSVSGGLLRIFDSSSWIEAGLVVFYGLLINGILFYVTYLMKQRTSVGFLLLGVSFFLAIDFCAVFPFNFLFFYEKFQSGAEVDRKKIIAGDIYQILNHRNNDTLAKYGIIVQKDLATKKVYDNIKAEADKNIGKLDNQANQPGSNNGDYYNGLKRTTERAVSANYKNLMAKSSASINNSTIYETALLIEKVLDSATKKYNDSMSLAKNMTEKRRFVDDYYNTLTKTVSIDEGDTAVTGKMTKFNVVSKSQLAKVLDVYSFVLTKIWAKNKAPTDEDERLTIQTLSVSLLVDLVPLAICLFFICFKRAD